MKTSTIGILVLFAAGCGHSKTAVVAPAEAVASTAAIVTVPAAPTAAPPTAVSSHVEASADLIALCRLDAPDEAQAAPKFSYDDASLLPDDRRVLDKVATCVTSGPLRGRHLQLTGRADPRGTEEYNLSLGTRRAEVVSGYLQRLGVRPLQLASSTRGALDAIGRDESTWQRDRRVDLELRD